MTTYFNGTVKLTNGVAAPAHLDESCAKDRTCICGFCKGQGQCQFGDCHNPVRPRSAETLCESCAAYPWRVELAGHRA